MKNGLILVALTAAASHAALLAGPRVAQDAPGRKALLETVGYWRTHAYSGEVMTLYDQWYPASGWQDLARRTYECTAQVAERLR